MAILFLVRLFTQKKAIYFAVPAVLTLTSLLVHKGNRDFFHPHFFVDYLFLTPILYFSKDFSKKFKILLTVAIVLVMCLIQFFWMGFKAPVSFFDIYAVKEVYAYSVPIFGLLIFTLAFIGVMGLVTVYKLARLRIFWAYLAIAAGMTFLLPQPNNWDPQKTFQSRGVVVSLFSEVFQMGKQFIFSKDQRHLFYLSQKELSITKKRNINILVLESLVVPQLLNDDLKKLSIKMELPWRPMISPTFGGQSARSEFEILCGIPSYKKPMIEFNFLLKDVNCLPNFLKKHGYQTIVSNPSKPLTFNARRAYSYLGFENQNWYNPKKNPEMEWLDKQVYDGSVLTKNIEQLKTYKAPYLNYIFGSYGHIPFNDDETKRPRLFLSENKQLEKIINIQIYREKEVIKWLGQLNKVDKDAINIVCGDHLPFIQNIEFGNLAHRNFCYSNIQLPESNLYKITVPLLKELGCEKCAEPTDLEKQYSYLMY